MKCKVLPTNEDAMNAFLATPGIKVQSKHIIPKEIPEIAIFYEDAEADAATRARTLITENEALDGAIETARKVSKDPGYKDLKTIAQREIFLLSKYNLTKGDAGTVIELLRPEMASVLGA
jgi:regulatory protein YycI of two-component signal transduction system YycFG